jgi:hypothetical protein
MSHTIKLVLPGPAFEQLDRLAAASDTRTATLASRLLQHAIVQAAEDGKPPPPPPRPVTAHTGNGRAPWLEPYGGDSKWRTATWAAIVTLRARYPRQLEHLKDKWWTDQALTETLAALAYWREEIDDNGTDPRQELAFHTQLNDYTQRLRQQSGGATKTWKPDALPTEWEHPDYVVSAG